VAFIPYPSPESDPQLRGLFDEVKRARGKLANIIAIQGGNPAALKGHMDLYLAIMFGRRGLTRFQRELIATFVSALNQCDYCIEHHQEALRVHCKDQELVEATRQGKISPSLSPSDQALLSYCRKVTLMPHQITEEDIRQLRRWGFSDEDILAANLIAAYFAMVNRIALGLGVELEEEGGKGYRY